MFYITISNGLLKNGHRKKMGSSVWEYMWLIDKITKIDDQGFGWIRGGNPIKLKELADDLENTIKTISKNLTKLEDAGYIKKILVPYGLIIKVSKAKKRFNQKVKPPEEEVLPKGETSLPKGKTCLNQKVKPIIDNINTTISVDKDNIPKGIAKAPDNRNPDIEFILNLFKEHYGIPIKPIKGKNGFDLNRGAAQRLVKQFSREGIKAMLEKVWQIQSKDKFCRISTNPLEFEKNIIWYKEYFSKERSSSANKLKVIDINL